MTRRVLFLGGSAVMGEGLVLSYSPLSASDPVFWNWQETMGFCRKSHRARPNALGMLKGASCVFAARIGIDLGAANVLAYVDQKGLVVQEPRWWPLTPEKTRSRPGHAALNMVGRTTEAYQDLPTFVRRHR